MAVPDAKPLWRVGDACSTLAGIIFGVVCWWSRRNLLAAITTCVLIGALPAMAMLRFVHCSKARR